MKGVADGLSLDLYRGNVLPEQRLMSGSKIMPAAGDFDGDRIAFKAVAADMGKSGIAAQQFPVADVADAAPDGLIDLEFALEETVETA